MIRVWISHDMNINITWRITCKNVFRWWLGMKSSTCILMSPYFVREAVQPGSTRIVLWQLKPVTVTEVLSHKPLYITTPIYSGNFLLFSPLMYSILPSDFFQFSPTSNFLSLRAIFSLLKWLLPRTCACQWSELVPGCHGQRWCHPEGTRPLRRTCPQKSTGQPFWTGQQMEVTVETPNTTAVPRY